MKLSQINAKPSQNIFIINTGTRQQPHVILTDPRYIFNFLKEIPLLDLELKKFVIQQLENMKAKEITIIDVSATSSFS